VRTAFIQELIKQARLHPEIFLIVGDLGYSVVEPFAAEFPDRFLNAGVAEQNMTGVAAGLASEGFHVFTYSIGNFPTLRCLEQIRNDICYHNLPVTVVAVGAGMAYGNLGYSHHCIQDIACLRGLPNLTLLSPGDPGETRACVDWLADNPGPSYLRLGKAGEPNIHSQLITLDRPFKVVNRMADMAIVATGSILSSAVSAAAKLALQGTLCDVFSFIRLAPLTDEDFSSLERYRAIVTVEEHVGPGGLGELVQAGIRGSVPVVRHFIDRDKCSSVGSQETLRNLANLSDDSLVDSVRLLRAILHP
jgi:transketolase